MPQTVSCNRCCCASIALSKLFCCCTIPDNNCLACTVSVIDAAPIVLPAAPKNPRNKAPIPTALFSLCTTLLFALVGATPNGSIFTTLYLYNSLLHLSLISPPPGLKISGRPLAVRWSYFCFALPLSCLKLPWCLLSLSFDAHNRGLLLYYIMI